MMAIVRSIAAGAALVLLLLLLFPPFMSIDPHSDGRVHAAIGHYPFWDPPSPQLVFRALYPDAAELPGGDRLADFRPRVNRVRITIYALSVGFAAGLAIWLLRNQGRRLRR